MSLQLWVATWRHTKTCFPTCRSENRPGNGRTNGFMSSTQHVWQSSSLLNFLRYNSTDISTFLSWVLIWPQNPSKDKFPENCCQSVGVGIKRWKTVLPLLIVEKKCGFWSHVDLGSNLDSLLSLLSCESWRVNWIPSASALWTIKLS